MKKEIQAVVYDAELRIEAYRFEGIVQPFPNHFHEHYVIGFIEGRERCLSCKNRKYTIEKAIYSCLIPVTIMLDLAEEVTGKRELPGFSKSVIFDEEISCYLRLLHEMVMNDAGAVLFRL